MSFGKPTAFYGKSDWRKNREEAIRFLSRSNSDLEFWCMIGGLNSSAIIEASKKQFREAGIQF